MAGKGIICMGQNVVSGVVLIKYLGIQWGEILFKWKISSVVFRIYAVWFYLIFLSNNFFYHFYFTIVFKKKTKLILFYSWRLIWYLVLDKYSYEIPIIQFPSKVIEKLWDSRFWFLWRCIKQYSLTVYWEICDWLLIYSVLVLTSVWLCCPCLMWGDCYCGERSCW